MQYNIRFKGIDHSNALVSYVEEKFSKLKKYELKPILVNVTFSEERHERVAEVFVKGLNKPMRAKAQSDNFHASLDMCLKKMERQLEREKSRIKYHKTPELSTEALLEEALRTERDSNRKAA